MASLQEAGDFICKIKLTGSTSWDCLGSEGLLRVHMCKAPTVCWHPHKPLLSRHQSCKARAIVPLLEPRKLGYPEGVKLPKVTDIGNGASARLAWLRAAVRKQNSSDISLRHPEPAIVSPRKHSRPFSPTT